MGLLVPPDSLDRYFTGFLTAQTSILTEHLLGGDDSLLKVWDRRQGFARPAVQNKRFDSGVTAIQSHVHDANLVAVGRYVGFSV